MTWDEPLPPFNTRYPDRLEGSLIAPFQEFEGHSPYPELEDKAAILFYLMIKDHPFKNGNKRIAVTTLLVFLAENGKWIAVAPPRVPRRTTYQEALVVSAAPDVPAAPATPAPKPQPGLDRFFGGPARTKCFH
ncbi:MAG TPA: type II toxin-antitoxin system death-on-curing family toxin [Candidatus Saccharimonadales bacterium]|nr:type II toxin-antitoxin system death-on-curing family toxin [Candidatus Saccharimonadales bacterium]